jgi:methylenetetrahydrofolate dehydrogenase (NADP+) / methenyltetrahydrofolate cyclohydrolase
MAQLLDGKKTAQSIKEEIAERVIALKQEGKRAPHLAAVLVGNDGASQTYVSHKVKACEEVGFDSTLLTFESDISEEQLLDIVYGLNNNPDIDGFIVQLPLPNHISVNKVLQAIAPEKDVDGFHPINYGRMASHLPAYIPATPFGILELIKRHQIETRGKHCVVVGRSHIVGAPISILMSRNDYPGDATVTITHRYTQDLSYHTLQADILIVAVGKPGMITANMVKEGAVVIDVGTTRVADDSKKTGYSLKGDVAFEEVAEKASWITPVPGGVGPMTIAGLLWNTLLASQDLIYQNGQEAN